MRANLGPTPRGVPPKKFADAWAGGDPTALVKRAGIFFTPAALTLQPLSLGVESRPDDLAAEANGVVPSALTRRVSAASV